MNELFAPPGTEWRPVATQLRSKRRMTLVVLMLLLAVLLVAGWAVLTAPLWLLVLVELLVVGMIATGWLLIGRNVRFWGYAERHEELFIRHGVMFRELIAVPYGRMQFVDVTSGPVERMYGIATVHLHTASPKTNARIPGLPAEEAARLRDRLTELGESQAAGL